MARVVREGAVEPESGRRREMRRRGWLWRNTTWEECVFFALGFVVALSESGANSRRGVLQTLLVAVEGGGVMGLLSDLVLQYPGSPR